MYNERVDTSKQESSPASARLLKKAINAANENVVLQIHNNKWALMSCNPRKTSRAVLTFMFNERMIGKCHILRHATVLMDILTHEVPPSIFHAQNSQVIRKSWKS